MPRAFSFPKSARLLQRAEFLAVKAQGRGLIEGALAASWLARPDRTLPTRPAPPHPSEMKPARARVGVTVSSKVGNAVVRNRIKRKLREAVRHELGGLPAVDLVVVARAAATSASVDELRRWLRRAAEKIRAAAPEAR